MSVLRRGDETMHYSDSSHRWVAPAHIDQRAWTAGVRAHVEQHRSTMGGPADPVQPVEHVPARVPRPRRAAARRSERVSA